MTLLSVHTRKPDIFRQTCIYRQTDSSIRLTTATELQQLRGRRVRTFVRRRVRQQSALQLTAA